MGIRFKADFVFAAGRGAGVGWLAGLAWTADLPFAIVAGFARGLRFVTGLVLVADLGLPLALTLTIGIGFATRLRLAGGTTFLATTNRRRGFRLAPGAADLALLADDARFMG